ncbi:F-box/LRR-repeat protein At1g67190-like [Punica granatum]|uniref:F-box domain-containing protein n=2 Tax=Punica granatum TaxID=22663 RepID=A0A218WNU1_PUNGR|nr:F-box/LRR-repeat protein At1g67190-like [Punica granatum]OWM73662.1 hypothetical protein CDL15_Pgr026762 [Punica granatum]PKI53684.1 hypothetical protein CRG98_025925 [Punica granatum]
MEHLPVEVIGNILSHISAARDVVLASATCRKWREAFRKHLRVLSFNSGDWHGFHDLSTSQIEILITRTIFQTSGLRSLLIIVDDLDEFSASVVMSWLLYTRDSLQELHYDVRTEPGLNVVEICGRQKLEKLTLAHDAIEQVDPNYHKFTSLRSLSLSYVHISEQDLSLLLAACRKLESLELIELDLSGPLEKVEVSAPYLRRFYMEEICLDKLVLEASNIEYLHLRDSNIEFFKVIGNGSLKKIMIDHSTMPHIEICDSAENLETIDFNNFTILPAVFYQLISKSLKLRTLRLWDVAFGEGNKVVDLETIALCCPLLSHLSLGCDLRDDELLPYCLGGSAHLVNMVYLKVGWSNTLKDEFVDLVEELLGRCPRIRKLSVDGVISGIKDHEDCLVLARFTTAIVRIMRKYIDVDVQFDFDN